MASLPDRDVYLLDNLTRAVDALLTASDPVYNLLFALKGTSHEQTLRFVVDEIREAQHMLEALHVSLGFPHPDDEAVGEG